MRVCVRLRACARSINDFNLLMLCVSWKYKVFVPEEYPLFRVAGLCVMFLVYIC